MSCFRLHSRSGVPTAPRKYLVVTMLAALTDQKSGNSTPRCSKLTEPSRQFVITTSRRSHVTWSYGCTPGVVKTRPIRSPLPVLPPDRFAPLAEPLTVSVMPSSSWTTPCPPWESRPASPPGAPICLPLFRCSALPCRSLVYVVGPVVLRHGCCGGLLCAQQGDLGLEVLERLEAAVNRREAQVCHFVQLPQRPEDREADVVCLDLGAAGGAYGLLDTLSEQ